MHRWRRCCWTTELAVVIRSAAFLELRYAFSVLCTYTLPDGSPCNRVASILDARHGRMLCREHAMLPLERMFGPRADLEEKAEYALRFLALPSAARHEILEALSSEDRREFLGLALMFASDDDRSIT